LDWSVRGIVLDYTAGGPAAPGYIGGKELYFRYMFGPNVRLRPSARRQLRGWSSHRTNNEYSKQAEEGGVQVLHGVGSYEEFMWLSGGRRAAQHGFIPRQADCLKFHGNAEYAAGACERC